MKEKKAYETLEIAPIGTDKYKTMLSGSVINSKIAPNTVEVEDYVEAFDGGFNISFDD